MGGGGAAFSSAPRAKRTMPAAIAQKASTPPTTRATVRATLVQLQVADADDDVDALVLEHGLDEGERGEAIDGHGAAEKVAGRA